MKNKLLLLLLILAPAGMLAYQARSSFVEEIIPAAEDKSAVNVVGYFMKNDTLDYIIEQTGWHISGADTTQTSGKSKKVRFVVRDSTAAGYAMEYTLLDFQTDSSFLQENPQARTADLFSRKIIGTTIRFETDDLGQITRFTNLDEVKAQARTSFKKALDEYFALPEAKAMKDKGFSPKSILKSSDIDRIVDVYTEEIKLFFNFHGTAFDAGESQVHEDATDTTYENDTYISATFDEEKGVYGVVTEITNYIPISDIFGKLSKLVEDASGKEVKIDKAENSDNDNKSMSYRRSYFSSGYLMDGWPYRIIKEDSSILGENVSINQVYIYLDSISRAKKR